MGWEEDYKIKKQKRQEYADKYGLVPPQPFFGERKEFQITSGAVRVTDPCYAMNTWCAGTLENVSNGNWLGWSRNVHSDSSWEWQIDDLVKIGFDPDSNCLTDEQVAIKLFEMIRANGKDAEKVVKESELYRKYMGHNPWGYQSLSTMIYLVEKGYDLTPEHEKVLMDNFLDNMKNSDLHEVNKRPTRTFKLLKDKICSWRQSMITVIHEDYKDDPRFSDENILDTVFKVAKRSDIHVGVDSGQAGIFDLNLFKQYAAGEDDQSTPAHEKFYDTCCKVSSDEASYRRNTEEKKTMVIASDVVVVDGFKMGYNSSSGYGDGGYTLRYMTDAQGKVILMNIMFITPEEYAHLDEMEEE